MPWLDVSNPGRYTGDRNFFDRYHGWELSEVVKDLGFVRADGKTLLAPAASQAREDVDARRPAGLRGRRSQSPNIALAERMGLPSGVPASRIPLAHIAGIFYSHTNGLMNLGGQQNGSDAMAGRNGTIATA